MYHYDPSLALEELNDEAVLPNPVHIRDMILRRALAPEQALELNREFQEYQRAFVEALNSGRKILTQLASLGAKV
jgi:hypothetical protein